MREALPPCLVRNKLKDHKRRHKTMVVFNKYCNGEYLKIELVYKNKKHRILKNVVFFSGFDCMGVQYVNVHILNEATPRQFKNVQYVNIV